MYKDSTPIFDTTRRGSRSRQSLCLTLLSCGFALAVLLFMGGCSATRVQQEAATGNDTASCQDCSRKSPAISAEDSPPETEEPPLKADQADTAARAQRADGKQESVSGHPVPEVKEEVSAATLSEDDGKAASDSKQAPAQSVSGDEESANDLNPTDSQSPPHPPAVRQYTVKGGENLYTIARQPFIYADGMLWPLIYRANRDQIKDPRQIYPGQLLNIPRDISEPDKEQARTKARQSPIFTPEEHGVQLPATRE